MSPSRLITDLPVAMAASHHKRGQSLRLGISPDSKRRVQVTIKPELCQKRWLGSQLAKLIDIYEYDDPSGVSMLVRNVELEMEGRDVEVTIRGVARDAQAGATAGTWTRTITVTAGRGLVRAARHDSFKLSVRYQRRGIAGRWIGRSFKELAELGCRKVTVYAAGGGDNGVYTWARMGFSPIAGERLWDDRWQREEALEIIERAEKAGLSRQTAARARTYVRRGRDETGSFAKIVELGRRSSWRSRQGNHLGKELMLISDGWEGKLELAA
jgi:hypothetical protein